MKNSIMADVEFASADFKKDDLVKMGGGRWIVKCQAVT